MDNVTLFAIGALAFAAVSIAFTPKTAVFAGLIFSCAVVPREIVTFIAGDDDHSGMASAGLSLHTYSVFAVLLILVVGFSRLRGSMPISFMLFTSLAVVLLLVSWEQDVARFSGVLLYVIGFIAWAGSFAFARAFKESERIQQGFALTLFVIALAQAGKSALQLLGVRDVGTLISGGEIITRVNGTLGHPGTLAKALFFVLVLALPLTRSATKSIRVLSWSTIGLAMITIGLTYGRANIAATGVLLFVWFLFGMRVRLRTRLVIIGALVVAAIPVLLVVLQRSRFDPFGGSRPQLIPAALEQISREPWFGIGPNSYIAVVSLFDKYTKPDLPVHNSFLLMTAELGLILTVLFFVPIVVVIVRSWTARKARTARTARNRTYPADGYAIALLGAVPGLLLTAVTGWGLFSEFMLPLFMVCFGFVAGIISTPRRASKSPTMDPVSFSRGLATAPLDVVSWRFWTSDFWIWRPWNLRRTVVPVEDKA
ncbi:O-antigen ligase family protein [Microbacterium sp. A84]|uniref:O-antigen ligase family protein n=1 Tax=Microbacterium sp. A84 TaxID=3450715 RepID=UPI003F42191D